jgi:hypothetical protein
VALERINLNVPAELRRRLRSVAKRLKKSESEVVRELLLDGLRRKEKEAFYQRVSGQMTPALRERLLEVAEAFERIDG